MKGLEPPRLAALDPKSSASTNFATSACVFWPSKRGANIQLFLFALYFCPNNQSIPIVVYWW